MTDQHIFINDDWRWRRDAHNVILCRRTTRKLRDKGTGKPTGEEVLDWAESYFSSLKNALDYLVEADASAATSLKKFTVRLDVVKGDIAMMLEQNKEGM